MRGQDGLEDPVGVLIALERRVLPDVERAAVAVDRVVTRESATHESQISVFKKPISAGEDKYCLDTVFFLCVVDEEAEKSQLKVFGFAKG